MIANLYLIADSFQYNGIDSEQEVLNKINALCSDLLYINQYKKENIIIADTKIYTANLFQGKTIFNICDQIDRDSRNLLFNIINSAKVFDSQDIVAECHAHNANNCAAILAFNPIPNIPEDITIIYNKKNWFSFRRMMLGKYPQNANYFIEECKKYYLALFFHENNKRVIGAYLQDYSSRFVEYLSYLNDDFRLFFKNHENQDNNTNIILSLFRDCRKKNKTL